ncbi:MAG: DNA-processing protein DprA [Polyangiaceae bacterium]|nr:DNA-processing protein DprA [Polyangiaceae bacterium]
MTRQISTLDPGLPADLRKRLQVGLPACKTIYVRGVVPEMPGIAVVGTRAPTPEALDLTRTIAERLTHGGWAVWSGGALGIDGAAHEATLNAGGHTVVVTPSGFDHVYPKEHAALFASVEKKGALLTTFAPDARPSLGAFHRRNKVLATCTWATVIIQAGRRSGARSTAAAARVAGRPLMIVPHAPWDLLGQGCALELQEGGFAIAEVDALMERLGRLRDPVQQPLPLGLENKPKPSAITNEVARSRGPATHAREHEHAPARVPAHDRARVDHAVTLIDPVLQKVFSAIGETPIHTDNLCELTGLGTGVVTAALLTLTLQAVVVEAPAGFYRRSAP